MNLEQVRTKVNRLLSDYKHAVKQVKEERVLLYRADDAVTYTEEAQRIVQHVAQAVQQKAHKRIASVVTRCLETVFDDPYEFRIEFERKRGRTEASIVFLRNGHTIRDLQGAVGGGVVAVAAFALRLACMVLSRPAVRRLVVLDEPFSHVHSPVYRERVKNMLETLSTEMDVQFVMVTGITDLESGTVVEIG